VINLFNVIGVSRTEEVRLDREDFARLFEPYKGIYFYIKDGSTIHDHLLNTNG